MNLVGTKLNMLDDISAYITNVIHHAISMVVYTRDGTSDSLTPELTLQLIPSLTLISSYFKLNCDIRSLISYHLLFQELYEQNKSSPLFGKEIEAR
jgi:hypothetical protein